MNVFIATVHLSLLSVKLFYLDFDSFANVGVFRAIFDIIVILIGTYILFAIAIFISTNYINKISNVCTNNWIRSNRNQ